MSSREAAGILNLPVIRVIESDEVLQIIAGRTLLGKVPRLPEIEIKRKLLAGIKSEKLA